MFDATLIESVYSLDYYAGIPAADQIQVYNIRNKTTNTTLGVSVMYPDFIQLNHAPTARTNDKSISYILLPPLQSAEIRFNLNEPRAELLSSGTNKTLTDNITFLVSAVDVDGPVHVVQS